MAHTPKDTHYATLRRARRDRRVAENPPPPEPLRLYGVHAVEAALGNPARTIHRVLVTRNAAARLGEALEGREREIPTPDIVEPRALDRLLGADAVHGGAAIECEPLPETTLGTLPDTDLLLALDQVTDPHNVGAVLRSAAAMGAGALITTARNAPAETAVLAKSASGALEHVPIVRARNLAGALQEIGQRGYRTVGLDSDGPTDLHDALDGALDDALDGPHGRVPLCLVLGAEGKGLRERTRETVDSLARLDMPGAIRSLNVSNAAAIALYLARRHLGVQDGSGGPGGLGG